MVWQERGNCAGEATVLVRIAEVLYIYYITYTYSGIYTTL